MRLERLITREQDVEAEAESRRGRRGAHAVTKRAATKP